MLRLQHHHDGTQADAVIEIDHVLVGHADAARRNRRADIFRLVGAVNPEQRVLAAGVEIERARAHRIVRPGATKFGTPEREISRGRMPGRPLGLAADLGDARPGHGFFADGDAVADRLAAVLHVIEIMVVGIDHDGAGGFLAVIVDDGAAERLGHGNLGVAGLGQQFLVARLESGLGWPPHRSCCLQPDNIRPAARIPNITFSDDMVHFQSKAPAFAAPILRLKRHNSINPIIGKNRQLFQMLSSLFGAAGGWLWLLCRKFCGFRLIFGQAGRCCRITATLSPPHRHKYGSAVNAPVIKRLPESG